MDTIPQDDSARNLTPKAIWIYALVDPTTQEIRYIGKTNNLHTRFLAHLRAKEDTHKARWIRSLQAQGLAPILQILEETTTEMWIERETHLIAFYRSQGCALTNISEGGQGDTGHPKTAEHKAKIAVGHRGKKKSSESIAKTVAGKKGKKLPPASAERKRKIGDAHRGRKHSAEHNKNNALAKRGKKQSPEHIAKRAAARRGKKRPPMSEEQKRKISETRLRKDIKQTPESIAKMLDTKRRKSASLKMSPNTPTLWDHAV